MFNEKNNPSIFPETNTNYHNLYETFLSTLKTRKLPEKKVVPDKKLPKKIPKKEEKVNPIKIEPVMIGNLLLI